jgi:actin-related protein
MDPKAIIIDNGSYNTKAGISGFLYPSLIFPTITGHTKYKKSLTTDIKTYNFYAGNEAESKRCILDMCNPIKKGNVDNWDNMIKLWEYIFTRLNIIPHNNKVLLTEPILNSIKNKEKVIETMFECFNVSHTFIGIQGILSLYGNGKTTGVILDLGHDISQITPVYDGYTIQHAVNRIDLAGTNITEYYQRLLELSGYRFPNISGKHIVSKIKEEYSYCEIDNKSETDNYIYKLPDGNKINITSEAYQSTEILFDPRIIGQDKDGIHKLLYDSIIRTDIDIRRPLFSNIVLAGGTSMIYNFDTRLAFELNKLVNINIEIEHTENRQYTSWIGGSILSSLSTFESSWISKQEYNDYGNSIIYRKSM